MLSMASVLEKTKKTRRRVFVEVVTASTKISFTDYTNFMRKITAFIILTGELEIRYISRCRVVLLKLISSYDKQEYHRKEILAPTFQQTSFKSPKTRHCKSSFDKNPRIYRFHHLSSSIVKFTTRPR